MGSHRREQCEEKNFPQNGGWCGQQGGGEKEHKNYIIVQAKGKQKL